MRLAIEQNLDMPVAYDGIYYLAISQRDGDLQDFLDELTTKYPDNTQAHLYNIYYNQDNEGIVKTYEERYEKDPSYLNAFLLERTSFEQQYEYVDVTKAALSENPNDIYALFDSLKYATHTNNKEDMLKYGQQLDAQYQKFTFHTYEYLIDRAYFINGVTDEYLANRKADYLNEGP